MIGGPPEIPFRVRSDSGAFSRIRGLGLLISQAEDDTEAC